MSQNYLPRKEEKGEMDWQVTATTILCDYVDDYAVLMVYGDGAAKCTYFNKYSHVKEKEKSKRLKHCKGLECPKVSEFRERALSM